MAHWRLLARLVTAGGMAVGRALFQAWKDSSHRINVEGIQSAAAVSCAACWVGSCLLTQQPKLASTCPRPGRSSTSATRPRSRRLTSPSSTSLKPTRVRPFVGCLLPLDLLTAVFGAAAEKGNSFYLQSKAVRARESLVAALGEQQRKPPARDDDDPPAAVRRGLVLRNLALLTLVQCAQQVSSKQ